MQISVIVSMTIHGGAQRLNSISHITAFSIDVLIQLYLCIHQKIFPHSEHVLIRTNILLSYRFSIRCIISNMLPDNPFHQS